MDFSKKRETEELNSFNDLWKGGYFVGDPLEPMGPNEYGTLGFISITHATYLKCIAPFVNKDTSVLEIGPGRGAFTRCFIKHNAKHVYCVDALSAEHNKFWEYVGLHQEVEYHQVEDL